jgi:hypothetical protein
MSISPERIFGMMQAHVQSAALKGGIDLGLFTAIGAGATSVATIAEACGASERGTRILCDYLTVAGLLTKTDGAYGLTPESAAFLDRKSPSYLGSAAQFMSHSMHMKAVADVAQTVRQGSTLLDGREYLDIENQVWVDFAEGMMPMMFPAAQFMAEQLDAPKRLLDIAAGHGIFGVLAAARLPRDPLSDVPMAAAFQERETTADSNFKCGPKNNSASIGSNLNVRSPPGKKCH